MKSLFFSKSSLTFLTIPLILYSLLFIYGASTYLDLKTQMWLGWGIVLALVLLQRDLFPNKAVQRIIFMLFCLFLTSRYWFFRTLDTLYFPDYWGFLAMGALYLAESYCIILNVLGMFANIFPIHRELIPVDLNDPNLPSVDIFIPTYNEPEEIVAVTATACTHIDYPKEKLNIYILDDGGTSEKLNDTDPKKAGKARDRQEKLKLLAGSLGVNYMTRQRNIHAKAGNISHALACTCPKEFPLPDDFRCPDKGSKESCGDLILMLDCDHVPTRDILKNLVGFFVEDEDLSLVQTPHFFINPDPVEKNLGTFLDSPGENEMFYRAIQPALDFWNSSFFCGSAGVLRRKHLAEIGGLAHDTITEDAETSLTLHGRGYKSAYVSRPMICGLSPETFTDFVLQRTRWAQGMVQIFRLKNPLFFKKLRFHQRLCYLNSCLFWFFGLARIIFVLAPLAYLIFGLKVYNASLLQILAYTGPHIFGVYLLSNYLFGHVRHPFFSELYETAQGFFNIPAVLSAVFRPRSPKFKVTPKLRTLSDDFLSPLATPFYLVLLLTTVGIPMSILRWFHYPLDHDAIIVCSVWSAFNIVIILLCLGIVWERRQVRRQHRIYTEEDVTIRIPQTGDQYRCKTSDLSLDGVGLVLDPHIPIERGDRFDLLARDSYGNSYTIPAEVVQAYARGERMMCGCRFVVEDEQTRKGIIGYVYGDSDRWAKFWHTRGSASAHEGGYRTCSLRGLRGAHAISAASFLLLPEPQNVTRRS